MCVNGVAIREIRDRESLNHSKLCSDKRYICQVLRNKMFSWMTVVLLFSSQEMTFGSKKEDYFS